MLVCLSLVAFNKNMILLAADTNTITLLFLYILMKVLLGEGGGVGWKGVPRSVVLCVCFVDRCLIFYPFSFLPFCCLFFFDLWILFIPLLSPISS